MSMRELQLALYGWPEVRGRVACAGRLLSAFSPGRQQVLPRSEAMNRDVT